MRQRGRIGAMAILAALGWPVATAAQDAFIRIEAKRGAAAEAAAAGWRGQFPDVVTVPLSNGMTGIVLGPQTPAAAAARMARLKAEGAIPGDSYLTGPGGEVPLPGVAAALEAAAAAAENVAPEGATESGDGTGGTPAPAAVAGTGRPSPSLAAPAVAGAGAEPAGNAPAEADAASAAEPAVVDNSPRHIQLQATPGRVSAAEALAEWRRTFPGARLWRMPGGWFAIALPAQPAAQAQQRMATLKAGRHIPQDAFLATPQELGERLEVEPAAAAADAQPAAPATQPAGGAAAPATSAGTADAVPPAPAVMPPVEDVQRALRWAGLYDGALDGQSGPATRAAIAARIAATGGTDSPAEAMVALVAEREAWRREMGMAPIVDEATGLTLVAPAGKLAFDRTERALSIYGPKDGSGAALILFAQPGGQQEMEDLAGLVTALGWVPHPVRDVARGRFTLTGANDLHVGHAEGRVQDGMAEGWVLIWPAADAETARRLAIEAGESFTRSAPADGAETAAAQP